MAEEDVQRAAATVPGGERKQSQFEKLAQDTAAMPPPGLPSPIIEASVSSDNQTVAGREYSGAKSAQQNFVEDEGTKDQTISASTQLPVSQIKGGEGTTAHVGAKDGHNEGTKDHTTLALVSSLTQSSDLQTDTKDTETASADADAENEFDEMTKLKNAKLVRTTYVF